MKNKSTNDAEEINDMNTLSVEGITQSFDNSTLSDSFVNMKEDL